MDLRHRAGVCLILLACQLAGCAHPAAESLLEVQSAVHSLHETRRAADALLHSVELTEDERISQWEEELLALDLREAIWAETDMTHYTDERLAEVMEELEKLSSEYEAVAIELEDTLEKARQEQEWRDRHIPILLHLKNDTGYSVREVRLTWGDEAAGDGKSDSLLPEGVVLAAGESILGLVAKVDTDYPDRQLILTDTDGNEHIYPFTADVNSIGEDGIMIVVRSESEELKYDHPGR